MNRLLLPTVLAWPLLAASAFGQMEKRDLELYERRAFREAAPAVDTMAPDLVLTDLDGKPVALSAWRGRYVVLIKAGYT